LIAVLYLGWQLGGLPFVPFDVFDWVGRVLPGAVVTFGIDLIVTLITALNLGETSTAAKAAEQMLAVGGLFITGVLAGAILFAVLSRWDSEPGYAPGLILGALVGVPVAFVSNSVNQTATAGPVLSGVWILLAFLAWGAAFSAVYRRLAIGSAFTIAPGTTVRDTNASAEQIDRRRFIVRVGGAAAVITVGGAAVGSLQGRTQARELTRRRGSPWSATNPLPNAASAVTPAPGTRRELTPVDDHYRIDINTRPPVVPERDWRLRIGGLVDRPVRLSLQQLRSDYEPLHQFITLACISNRVAGDLIGTTRWTGVSLRRVLANVGLKASATHIQIKAVDGFDEVVALDEINSDERIMLTYAWDGLPLTAEHGFPLRIYIPDRYGMKQPKWIESIEVIDHWEPGYWVRRQWSREARMKATSVIDTIATNMMVVEADRRMLIPVGGIAHAGARGISRVAVSVDGGPWQDAKLRQPLSGLTWVIWRFDWPFQPGQHSFTVRCWEGSGTAQIAEQTPVRPDGATGLHGESVML
jgi:DMSO/TMAO reductase YedYZ molybdopterin-dependent catalytic subunit